MRIVGIDIGTTSICGVVTDPEQGLLLRSVTRANDSGMQTGSSFERCQDPMRILQICTEIYQNFIREFTDVSAVGFTGQMHGILYTDALGNALSPLYTWQDERGKQPYDQNHTYAQELSRRTGYTAATGYGLTTMFYNRRNRLQPQNAAHVCTIHDFVAMKFCARTVPVMHVSDAASFGLFDLKKLSFDGEAVAKAQLNDGLLPQVAETCDFIGETAEKIPVCTAIGDNQASVLGSVCDGGLLVNVGTGSQVSVICDEYIPAENIEYRPYFDGKYLMTGCALAGGYSYSLLKNFFVQTLELFGITPTGDIYDRMNDGAASVYSQKNPIVCKPYFCGTRQDPALRADFEEIGADNFTPEHLTLSVLRGICEELYGFYTNFCRLLKDPPHTLVGSGNGIRKNKLLAKIFSDRFHMPLRIPKHEEEAAFGCTFAAYAALKNLSVQEMQKFIRYQ